MNHNPVPSKVNGDPGHHGPVALNRVAQEPRPSRENATVLPQHTEVKDAQDTPLSELIVKSNHVRSTVDGLHGATSEPVLRAVVVEAKLESVPAPTQPLNTAEASAVVQQNTLNPATQITVQSMEDGQNGECGENARNLAEVDVPTGCESVSNQCPNMVAIDAPDPQSWRNNAVPFRVRSTVVGPTTEHSDHAPRLAVVDPRRHSDTVTLPNLCTMDSRAPEETRKSKLATPNTAPLMENTPHGRNGAPAHSPVVVVPRHVHEHVLQRNTVVNHVLRSDIPLTNRTATPNCAQ